MKHSSIRFKLTLWFSLMLIVTAVLTFLIIRMASAMVLRGTIRDYLISMVEENTNKIEYAQSESDVADNIYIPYGSGYLAIDDDFLDVVNDVHAALYSQDGTMLYGENPLEKHMSNLSFTETYVWHVVVAGERYEIYDRALSIELPDQEKLWIRGIVPETKSVQQLRDIGRISLFLIPLLLLITIVSGYFLIGRFLRPIGEIERTANKISKGDDLKERIDVVEVDDEVGRLAKVFNHMLDRLENSFNTEKQFTSDASHELRTPTSVIMAQSEYILEKDRSPEEYKEAMEVVQKQSQRMNALIGDMLDYTRMDQKTGRYPMEEINLSKLVEEVTSQMQLIRENNITLSFDVEPEIYIEGNAMLISRLLQNLISNAYRYGVDNGNIAVVLKKKEGKPNLSVIDDGVGISEEDMEKIFDRFYRSDSSRTLQGTGLGLSMVKRICELHRADLSVDSKVGEGSIFKVVFNNS